VSHRLSQLISGLTEALWNCGYKVLTSVDFSREVITQMKRRTAALCEDIFDKEKKGADGYALPVRGADGKQMQVNTFSASVFASGLTHLRLNVVPPCSGVLFGSAWKPASCPPSAQRHSMW
jgi:hypothetical protein